MKRLALAALLALALPVQAQMYKCVDARGVVHYTDKPIPGCKGGPVNIRGSGGAAAPEPAPAPAKPAAEAPAAPPKPAAAQGYTPEECTALRKEHDWLSAGGRFGRLNEKGERVYDDAGRPARIAELEKALQSCP